MERQLDVVFIQPDSSVKAYQDLHKVYAAIEPPTWALILAESCRQQGFGVAIIDCVAEKLTDEEAVEKIQLLNPRLACFVLYGQNPNSGTTSMIGGIRLARVLKDAYSTYKTCFVGSHVSALPKEVISYDCVDFVLLNEGVYAIHNLLRSDLGEGETKQIKGIGYKHDGLPILNQPERVVPQDLMYKDMPGYAWDLLPYEKKPLDLYRSHFWHAQFDHKKRSPFAAIYTSLGCRFQCDFCMINIVNRNNNDDHISAANSPGMRYWPVDLMLKEFEKLADYGVETLRISDEMFFLNKKYYEPLLQGIIDRGLKFRMWSYSRVDTVNPRFLELFKNAGIDWLCLGIESGNQNVRREISKGKFQEINIRDAVKQVQEHDMYILGNYIFGFPNEKRENLQETLDLALELNTEHANFYPCQALPGSPIYHLATSKGWALPDSYEGYAFLSYECKPLPTNHLTAAEVLKFRDDAWHTYFSNPDYLSLVEQKFGVQQRSNVEEMSKIRLKRQLLGE